jgi:integrase
MGHLKKQKDGYYRVSKIVNGKKIEARAKTERQAKERLDRKTEEYHETIGKPASKYTFDNYYQRKWLPERSKTVKPATIRKQSFQYDRLSEIRIEKTYPDKPPVKMRFVDIRLTEMKREDIRKLQTALQQITAVRKDSGEVVPYYKASSINDMVSFVKHILYGAMDDEYLTVNPAARVKALRVRDIPANETIHRALTIEESDRFFKEAAGSWYYPLYVFMISSGLRIGEAAALKWSDIKPQKGVIHVGGTYTKNEAGAFYVGSTKTEAGKRDVIYTDIMKEAVEGQRVLKEMLFGENDRRKEFIFCSPTGLMVREGSVNRDMARICERAGIERITSHGLRDSFSTRALESGMAMKTLQKVLGHADFATTSNTYAHVTDDTKRKESRAINSGVSIRDFKEQFALKRDERGDNRKNTRRDIRRKHDLSR